MPYHLARRGGGWVVVSTDTGKIHSRKPMSRAAAERQMAALYSAMGDEARKHLSIVPADGSNAMPETIPAASAPADSRGAGRPEIRRKTFDFEVKALGDDGPGTFDVYAAEFHTIDRAGEKIAPDAFRNLDEFVRDGFFALSHDWKALPIGTIDEARPDGVGLRVRGTFHSTPEAQAVRTVMRERLDRKKSVKLSIGYRVLAERKAMEGGKPYTILTSVDLLEASYVTVPANPSAVAVAVKSGVTAEDSDADGGATVRAGMHVKWAGYKDGMTPGCGTVEAVYKSGTHGGMAASEPAPVASVLLCKAAGAKAACGCSGEAGCASGESAKCVVTKATAHHPVGHLTPADGTPAPMDEDEDDAAGADSEAAEPAPESKGQYLGNTDETMAYAAFDRIHAMLGYYVVAQIFAAESPAEVRTAVAGAIDEYRDEVLRMLGALLVADDPADAAGPRMLPDDPAPASAGYSFASAPQKYLAKLASHDISRDGLVSGLSLETLSREVVSAVGEIRAVGRRHFAARLKEGRTLSAATRTRIRSVHEALRPLLDELDSLLAETEPKPKADAAASDAPSVAAEGVAFTADGKAALDRKRRILHLKARAALLGVAG